MRLRDDVGEYLVKVLALYLGGLLGYIASGGLGCSDSIENRTSGSLTGKSVGVTIAYGIDRSSVRLVGIGDYPQVVVSGKGVAISEGYMCAAAYTQLLAEQDRRDEELLSHQ